MHYTKLSTDSMQTSEEVESMEKMGELILKGFFQASNQRDFSFIPRLYSPKALIHTLDGDKYGPEVIIELLNKWVFAIPDFQFEPLAISIESDVLVVHWRAKGTFMNQVRDIPPTGKRVSLHGLVCFRCFQGQVVEHWARVDYRPLTHPS